MITYGYGQSYISHWDFSIFLFAWLGMIDFLLPILLAVFGGNKFFCNHLCGEGNYTASSEELSNVPVIAPRRNGWRQNGFDTGS